MIVTLTANPSIDRTVTLTEALQRGAVHRAAAVNSHPGGKGVNVSRVIAAAGRATVAVLPGNTGDPLLRQLGDAGIAYRAVPMPGTARTNLTIAETDGTTTKINEPGPPLTSACAAALAETLDGLAGAASWMVLSGSLPPGVPTDWYVALLRRLRGIPVAIDASDAPLRAVAATVASHPPRLLKPNAEELGQLTSADPAGLENPVAAARAAATLVERGVGTVLATLGKAGAVLVTPDGAWYAAAPRVTPRSTVGAGDSALAGYLLADSDGAEPAERLRHAVAYGSAAAALPGTGVPGPQDIDLDAVCVTALDALHNT